MLRDESEGVPSAGVRRIVIAERGRRLFGQRPVAHLAGHPGHRVESKERLAPAVGTR